MSCCKFSGNDTIVKRTMPTENISVMMKQNMHCKVFGCVNVWKSKITRKLWKIKILDHDGTNTNYKSIDFSIGVGGTIQRFNKDIGVGDVIHIVYIQDDKTNVLYGINGILVGAMELEMYAMGVLMIKIDCNITLQMLQ